MKISTVFYKFFLFLYWVCPFKKITCLILKKINYKIEKYYKDFRFKGVFTLKVNTFNSIKLFHFGGKIENESFWKGLFNTFESEMGWLWILLSEKSNIIFDIGANTGIYSLVSKAVNPSSKIYAFEPSNNTFSKLKKNISLNKFDVHCYNIALSNKSGSQVFYDSYDTNQTSASMSHKMHELWGDYDVNSYKVDTITLDSFIFQNSLDSIDLIKLDVEMYEPEVIEGFLSEIFLKQPIIFIEVLSDEVANKLMNLLNNQYVFYHLDEKNVILKKDILKPIPFKWNYLICPINKIIWFEREFKEYIKN